MHDELERRKAERPLDFVELHPKQQEAEHQQEVLKKRIIVLFWGNRCLPFNTPVLMANGSWKQIKDVKIGDFIKNGNGKNTQVISVIDSGIKQVYKLTFSDGSELFATEDHNFPVLLKHGGKFLNKSVRYLIDREPIIISKSVKFLSLKYNKSDNTGKSIYKHKTLVKIEPYKKQQCYGLTVESKDHKFITWDYFVTCNCGKTEFAAIRVAKIMTGRSKLKNPPVHGWAFCPSYEAQADTTQKKLLQYLGDAEIDWDKTTYIRKGILKCLVLKNGSTLTFKSYEQGREKVQGAGLDFVWFDEEPPHDIYEEATMRVEAGKRLLIIMTMTPIKGMTWVYKTIYLNTSDPSLFVSTAGWDDNPYLTTEQKDLMGRGLSDVMIQVRRYGKFTRRVGLVCNWFDRMVHVIPYSQVPKTGTILRGIDFGWTAPTCILWVLLDASHNVYIFDGIYKPGLTTPEITSIINLREASMGIVIGVGDSAQASDIAEMKKAGINIIGIEKQSRTKQENWDEYRARLLAQYGQVNKFTNKPKLFIADTVLEQDNNGELYNFVVKEFESLLWDTKLNKETGEEDTSRTWGDQAKHAVDALTYILAHMVRPQDNVKPVKNVQPKYTPMTEYEGYKQEPQNYKPTSFMN